LDDIPNIAWCKFDVHGGNTGLTLLFATAVDATLHKALDKYEIFAITVSLNYGETILPVLKNDLAYRQSVMDKTGRLLPRNFQASRIPSLSSKDVLHVGSVFFRIRISAGGSAPSPPWLHAATAQF
jgi:hypothetical protein